MIQSITQPDTATVVALTVASELFTAEESTVVETMLTEYFAGRDTEGHTCLVDESTATCSPSPTTNRSPRPTAPGS